MSHTVVGISSSRVKEGKPRRHRHGIKIKVSTPGSASAGAGSILKRLRSSKVSGVKEGKPRRHRHGIKIKVSTPGSASAGAGSILKRLRSSKVSGDVGNATEVHTSSKDGMTCTKTCMDCDGDIAGPSVGGVKAVNADGSINIESFAEKMKQGMEDRELLMNYEPQFSSEACSLQLYGYFVGTSMDYRIVNSNLSKMWRVYGIDGITKTSSGVFYFKFKSEEGMKAVLESGHWMEPGIWLEKVEPSTIPIWVCVYNIPMELCNGAIIGKIMSGIGKPMLMDKMTKERCLKKSGKLDFARVLVEVSANEDLPEVRPRDADVPVNVTQNGDLGGHDNGKGKNQVVFDDSDGFVTVGKNNKPVNAHNNGSSSSQQPKSATANIVQVKSSQYVSRQTSGNSWQSKGRVGPNFQGRSGSQQGNASKSKGSFGGSRNIQQGSKKMASTSSNNGKKVSDSQQNVNVDKGVSKGNVKSGSFSQGHVKSVPASQANFKPRVLVRGSSFYSAKDGILVSDVPVSNSFEALASQTLEDRENEVIASMDKEYSNVIEPKLMKDVIDVMESGVFPSMDTRMKWSLTQMDFFYNNCHKYGLDPSFEDDDVATVDGDLANEMRPEYEIDGGQK
ncbi:hypothetical protein CTI12_AA432080 [Artemisia annua]|uniref:DUF4283 domain-containing protein n=1 Tax=Artemisia annua TaxID=35608 RepID=A0A2U1M0Y1_ARTAN|nr:hypothetical protein CTI12_AA432080 [Artemisia annua]